MPKLTKSDRKKLKSEIKLIMVQVPGISTLQISKQVGRDYDLVAHLKKEIEEELSKNIEEKLVEEEVAKFQLLYEAVMPHLWNILMKKKKIVTREGIETEIESSPMEKVAAINTMIKGFEALFNKKFDAGMFSRKLGEVEVKNKAELLKVILDNIDEQSRNQFLESSKRFLRRRAEGGGL
ncbi:MAG TPA: hypothetical protein PK723_04425 [Candidatus Pacearchaeota archaeon]|nr:hypothetical protein [Candidatus Pacearchaeota archaeon]HPZ75041.1 hypothetical protein [Candidatus Pacearchaeota archaeon]